MKDDQNIKKEDAEKLSPSEKIKQLKELNKKLSELRDKIKEIQHA